MPGNAKEYAICILARLTIDKCIVDNGELQMRIEDAIASLISSIAEEQKEELVGEIPAAATHLILTVTAS
jgi:hypothetical protein